MRLRAFSQVTQFAWISNHNYLWQNAMRNGLKIIPLQTDLDSLINLPFATFLEQTDSYLRLLICNILVL